MDFLGIGPLELFFVLFLALLIFGPDDLVKTGKTIGRFFNKVIRSDGWRAIRDVNREIRDLPNRLAKEAALEDSLKEVTTNTIHPPEKKNAPTANQGKESNDTKPAEEKIEDGIKAWTTPPSQSSTSSSPNVSDK